MALTAVMDTNIPFSASYGHDVHRLFAKTREREDRSGHPLISLTDLTPRRADRN